MEDANIIFYISHFSYLAIFLLAIFSGYLIPIPEEIILLITGYMVKANIIQITPAIFIIIFAFVLGDNILYKLTLENNKHVSKLIHEVLSLKIIIKKRLFFEKHIGTAILLTRFIPFLRFVGPVFSGYIKVDQKTFMLFNTLAIVIYAPFVIWIGYYFSEYLNQIVLKLGQVKHIIFVIILVIIGLLITRSIDFYFNKKDLREKNKNVI